MKPIFGVISIYKLMPAENAMTFVVDDVDDFNYINDETFADA